MDFTAFSRTGNRLLAAMMFFCMASCTEEPFNDPFCTPGSYFPLKTGNYWIFRTYTVYADGTLDESENDSLYISGDTLMRGYRFFHLAGSFHQKPVRYFLTVQGSRVVSAEGYLFFECPQWQDNSELHPFFGFDFPCLLTTNKRDSAVAVKAGKYKPVMEMVARSMMEGTKHIVTYRGVFAAGIGIIKFSSSPEPGKPFQRVSELIRFKAD